MIAQALSDSGLIVSENNDKGVGYRILSLEACAKFKGEPDRNINERKADVRKLEKIARRVLTVVRSGEPASEDHTTLDLADKFCRNASEEASEELIARISKALSKVMEQQIASPPAPIRS